METSTHATSLKSFHGLSGFSLPFIIGNSVSKAKGTSATVQRRGIVLASVALAIIPLGFGKEKVTRANIIPIHNIAANSKTCPVYGRSFGENLSSPHTRQRKTAIMRK